MIIPIFFPHLGCHDRCIYCNQAYITDSKDHNNRSIIEKTLGVQKGFYEVGLYGGNIFGLEPPQLKKLFTYFEDYMESITNFRISTKPAPLNKETLTILKEHRVTIVELGIPTFNDKILRILNRQHTVDDLHRAYYMLHNEGFNVALQVMVGLPHETMEDIKETVKHIIRLTPYYIRIYPLVVLKGTPLHRMYEGDRFISVSFEEAIRRTLFIYLNALQHNIKVTKMGLTENEIIKDSIVAGPYHPSFGYMVKSQAMYLAIKTKIETSSIKGSVCISLNNKDIPHLIGHKRSNIKNFDDQGIDITWTKDDIKQGCFLIKYGDMAIEGNIFDALSSII